MGRCKTLTHKSESNMTIIIPSNLRRVSTRIDMKTGYVIEEKIVEPGENDLQKRLNERHKNRNK